MRHCKPQGARLWGLRGVTPPNERDIMKLTASQLATILHALRSLQSQDSCKCQGDHFNQCEQLTHDDIDELCEDLNCSAEVSA